MSTEIFYFLRLINTKNGERGYVCIQNGQIMIADQYVQSVKTFQTYQEAQKFIRENKLEKKGISVFILDNNDLIKEASNPLSGIKNIKPAEGDVYVLVNPVNQMCFYDTEKSEYYFKDGEIGAVCFFSMEQVDEFFTKVKFAFEVKPLKLENKKK